MNQSAHVPDPFLDGIRDNREFAVRGMSRVVSYDKIRFKIMI